MTKKIGNAGAVLATATVAGIRQWEITEHQDEKDTLDFAAAGVTSYLMGASRWFGSFRGFRDAAPLALSNTAAVTATFQESSSTGGTWAGSIFINDRHVVVEAGEVIGIDYAFIGSGTLAPATSTT